jgi:hypothetical protein
MKTLNAPISGKCGQAIASRNHYGSYYRGVGAAPGPGTPAQLEWRRTFGPISASWGTGLTKDQYAGWRRLAAQTRIRDWTGNSRSLTGQACYAGVNSVLARLGRPKMLDAPALAVFGPNPVGALQISRGEGGLALKLSVAGPVLEEIMVYGAPPCSAGREKPVYLKYLGLLGVPEGAAWDITELYVKEFGEPAAGLQVFICTRQQLWGQESHAHLVGEIVPAQ